MSVKITRFEYEALFNDWYNKVKREGYFNKPVSDEEQCEFCNEYIKSKIGEFEVQ